MSEPTRTHREAVAALPDYLEVTDEATVRCVDCGQTGLRPIAHGEDCERGASVERESADERVRTDGGRSVRTFRSASERPTVSYGPGDPATDRWVLAVSCEGGRVEIEVDGETHEVPKSQAEAALGVDDGGTAIINDADRIDFGSNVNVTNNGDGTVTVSASSDADTLDGFEANHFTTLSEVNSNADVPNADFADTADEATRFETRTTYPSNPVSGQVIFRTDKT